MNLTNNEIEDVTIKYFEAGHSFMSADSVHHELEMTRQPKGNVFDYQHLEQVVKESNGGRMDVISIQNSDVRNWRARQSQAKLKQPGRPMLNNVCIVQFRRNSRMMHYKCDYDDAAYEEFDFLVNRYICDIPPLYRDAERGIPEKKKQDIISILLPLMPSSRHEFWKNMPTGSVPDLIFDDQVVCDD